MKRIGTDGRAVTTLQLLAQWVSRHLGRIGHERRVMAIARELVNHTVALHSLDRRDLRLLKMAALVHDIGRCVNEKRHPSIGAEMILEDSRLPLKGRQRRALAYLTRYHRDEVPEAGEDAILRRNDDAERLRMLLAFLRVADTLDCRSLPAPRLAIRLRDRCLRITCGLREDSDKVRRVFSRRRKFRLLEEVLDCRVEVALQRARRLTLAA